MLPRTTHDGDGDGRLTASAVQALQTLDRLDDPARGTGLLVYYKQVERNPFQRLLYAACWRAGIAPVAVPELASLDDLPVVGELARHLTLHLHWTSPLTAGAVDEAAARVRVDAVLARIDRLRDDGGTFVWTMHNVWPHALATPDAELALRRGLVARADLVHVLNRHSVAAADRAGYPMVEDRVLHLPHPSYVGAYPTRSDVLAVRNALGLDPTAPVLGVVGTIRPYKRIGVLLDAFDDVIGRTQGTGGPQLLIAGPGADQDLRDRIQRHPAAVGVLEPLADRQLVDLVRACDVIVLPYVETLNSGSLVLALSCHRPVVAPAVESLQELVGPPACTTFDPERPTALADALAAAVGRAGDPAAGAAAAAAAAALDPDEIAAGFAAAVRGLWVGQQAPSDL